MADFSLYFCLVVSLSLSLCVCVCVCVFVCVCKYLFYILVNYFSEIFFAAVIS